MNYKTIENIEDINPNFFVCKLTEDHLDSIYDLYMSNVDYFVLNNILLNENYIKEKIVNKEENRYYLGFYEFGLLLAIIDFSLINDEVNIDFYMIQKSYSGCDISSRIISNLEKYLKTLNYNKITTDILENDIRALNFCLKNNFVIVKKANQRIYLSKIL